VASRYARGADFERALRKALESFPCVAFTMRAAGSHGKVDVLALRKSYQHRGRDAALFQCKTGGVITVEERNQLGRIAHATKMTAAVVSKAGARPIVVWPIDKNGNYTTDSPLELGPFLDSYMGWSSGG